MKRLDVKEECILIYQTYGRYGMDGCDSTTSNTCFALLNWAEKRADFDKVSYVPGKGFGNLRRVWGEKKINEIIRQSQEQSKHMRHRKTTIRRCWDLLLNDMNLEE